MANILKQIVVQEAAGFIPKRFIVQYLDDVSNENKQVIVNYDDLSVGDKTTFDNFESLAESQMV